MELTNDVLLKAGFKSDNPNNALTSFYLTNDKKPEWRISIKKLYKPYSNKLMYTVDCWLCNMNGIIIKRASLTDVTTTLELQKIIDLCKINHKLIINKGI
ncbi:hypothetical protein IKN40_01750 [bacterium]|nr:hypothetical protein [bacterium]